MIFKPSFSTTYQALLPVVNTLLPWIFKINIHSICKVGSYSFYLWKLFPLIWVLITSSPINFVEVSSRLNLSQTILLFTTIFSNFLTPTMILTLNTSFAESFSSLQLPICFAPLRMWTPYLPCVFQILIGFHEYHQLVHVKHLRMSLFPQEMIAKIGTGYMY